MCPSDHHNILQGMIMIVTPAPMVTLLASKYLKNQDIAKPEPSNFYRRKGSKTKITQNRVASWLKNKLAMGS